jgi:hypothetical protein
MGCEGPRAAPPSPDSAARAPSARRFALPRDRAGLPTSPSGTAQGRTARPPAAPSPLASVADPRERAAQGELAVKSGALGVVLLVALTACGGGTRQLSPSEDRSFRAAVERVAQQPIADWPAYVKAGRDICEQDARTFRITVATFANNGILRQLRLIARHLCPDRTRDLAHVREDVATVQAACDVPAADRTATQRDMAEAMAC